MPHHGIPCDVTRHTVVREVAAAQLRLNAGPTCSRSADIIAASGEGCAPWPVQAYLGKSASR